MIDTPKELIKAYKDYHDYLKTKIYAPDRVQRSNIYYRLQKIAKRTDTEEALLKELQQSVGDSMNLDVVNLTEKIIEEYRKCLVGKTFILKENPWDVYVYIQEVKQDEDSVHLQGKLVGTNSAYTTPEITPWGIAIKGGITGLSRRVANECLTEIPFFSELTEVPVEVVIARMEDLNTQYKALNDAAIAKFREIVGGSNV